MLRASWPAARHALVSGIWFATAAVACVAHADGDWQTLSPHGVTGSAVLIAGQRILTNAHVVRDFADLVATIESGSERFVRIVTESGAMLALERDAVRTRQPLILARYGVHADRSPGLAAGAPSGGPAGPAVPAALAP